LEEFILEGHEQIQTYKDKQKRFTQFIQAENERLNRLIRNLHLYLLQFKHYTKRDLYDRICQEVAVYFQAANCEIYLVRYEEREPEEGKSKVISYSLKNGNDSKRCLTKWLELVGAYGPARRALRQQYIRQRSRCLYEIPMVELSEPAKITSMTQFGFVSEDPTRYTSAYDWRSARDDSLKQESSKNDVLRKESPRQVVWYQDGLYNSCRCSLMVSLMRESGESVEDQDTRYHRKIGLIKVENRTPSSMPGFSDVPSEDIDQNHLFFPKEWEIAALRPYVRDLHESVKRGKSPFFPLHNNIGWQQYFEDHPLGAQYYQELRQKLNLLHEGHNAKFYKQELPKRYNNLEKWLEELTECLIRIESWLQHLKYACRLIKDVGVRPTLDKPTPSLFNIYNLRAAYLELPPSSLKASSSKKSDQGNQERYVYDVVREVLEYCLTRNQSNEVKLLSSADKCDKQDVEKIIQQLCERRADAMRKKLGIKDNPFNIIGCLDAQANWKFQEVMNDINQDLNLICRTLENQNQKEIEEVNYELISEELEVSRISNVVRAILNDDRQGEVRYGVACALLGRDKKYHEEAATTGCKLARALAAATMYADSFHQIDEKRLIFIASHIVQVLDNHLLYQSRQHGLELDFDTLNVIGLEHFGLELLDTLHSCSQRIAHGLGYLLKHQAYRRGRDELQLQNELKLPRDFVREIGSLSRMDSTQEDAVSLVGIKYSSILFSVRSDFVDELNRSEVSADLRDEFQKRGEVLTQPLVEVKQSGSYWIIVNANKNYFIRNENQKLNVYFSAQRVGTYVLKEIVKVCHRLKCLHWLKFESPVPYLAGRMSKVTFLPNEKLIPNDREPHAKIILLENADGKETDEERMEIHIWLKGENLQKHDLQALWSAVKVLEEVLKVTEATAGSFSYGTTTTK
jgi:hypothetical protein